MSKPLTISALRIALRSFGFCMRTRDGEYAVYRKGTHPVTDAYFTNDRDDALNTAITMCVDHKFGFVETETELSNRRTALAMRAAHSNNNK